LGLGCLLNGVGVAADDEDRLRRVELCDGVENWSEEWTAVQVVENFGRRGLEALAFTGRKHDGDERAELLFGHQLARAAKYGTGSSKSLPGGVRPELAGPPGFEPGLGGPNPPVL